MLREFEHAGRTAKASSGRRFDPGIVSNVVYHAGHLIQTAGETVYVLTLDDELIWKKRIDGDNVLDFPTIDPENNRLFVVAAPMERHKRGARNAMVSAQAVIALDFKSGKELWRTSTGGKQVSQVTYAEGGLFLYEAMPIGHDEFSMLRLDAASGREVWKYNGDKKELGQKLEMIVRDGKLYSMSHGVAVFDTNSGDLLDQWRYGVNARCDSSRATEKYLLLAYGNIADYAAETPKMTHQRIARSSCASGAFPAYGMQYFAPNACGCESWLRGHLALHSRPLPESEPIDQRWEQGPAFNAKSKLDPDTEAWPQYRQNARRTAMGGTKIPQDLKLLWHREIAQRPEGAVTTDWQLTNDTSRLIISAPTVAEEHVVVSVPHAHKVVSLDALSGEQRWVRHLEGRPDAPPTIAGELCFVSTRHGWVYALHVESGEVAWRFRAAPAEQLIVAYGQLESAWPLFGPPIVKDDAVFVCAGRHPEAGGLYFFKLDAATGKVLASKELSADHPWQVADQKHYATSMNDIVNQPLVEDNEGNLHIPGVTISPDDSSLTTGEEVTGEVIWYTLDVGTGATRSPAFDPAELTYYGDAHLHHNASINGAGNRRGALASRLVVGDGAVYGFGMHGSREWDRYTEIGQATYADGKTQKKVWGQKLPVDGAALIKAGDHLLLSGATHADRNEVPQPVLLTLPASGGTSSQVELPATPLPDGLAAAYGRVYISLADGSIACLGK